jgi:hypothetical protein
MYLITSPIVRNGISWPRFGKGKYTLTINLDSLQQIRCLLALAWYNEEQPHFQISICTWISSYLVHEDDGLVWLVL